MPHRLRREAGDLGRDANVDSFATDDRPTTYTKGMTFLSLFQSMDSAKH
jgi:hypothetical protein